MDEFVRMRDREVVQILDALALPANNLSVLASMTACCLTARRSLRFLRFSATRIRKTSSWSSRTISAAEHNLKRPISPETDATYQYRLTPKALAYTIAQPNRPLHGSEGKGSSDISERCGSWNKTLTRKPTRLPCTGSLFARTRVRAWRLSVTPQKSIRCAASKVFVTGY